MTLAAIDIGTNSVKLLVARVSGRRVTPLLTQAKIVRLGEGLHKSGAISKVAADRTVEALRRLRRLAERRGAVKIAAAGTQALRRASNARGFLKRCREEAGVDVRVITGEEEARLSFQGAAGTARAGRVVGLEIGGGSTQIMVGGAGRLRRSWSLPLGAVTLTERFLKSNPPAADEMMKLSAEVRRALRPVAVRSKEVVGVGGTIYTVLRVLRPGELHGKAVPTRSILALAILLSLKSTAQRRRMGIEKGRADIIAAGAWILASVLDHLGAESLRASGQGLRHGLLIELASGAWA